jgi:hypothetical protein
MAARRRSSMDAEKRGRPATSPEQRENELVALAHDEAERQIRSGNASSQVITHFLKLGSSREKLEQERLAHENELLQVKREAIESQKRVEELYINALDAMRSYSGFPTSETPDDEDADVY